MAVQVLEPTGKDASAWVGHSTVKREHGCWMPCRASSSAESPDGLADPRTASNRARRPCSGRGLFCVQAVTLRMAVQVLEPTGKEGSTRIGGTTLKRERCLLDALQRQLFMRVNAIRALFRVSPLAPPFWAPLHAAACTSKIR